MLNQVVSVIASVAMSASAMVSSAIPVKAVETEPVIVTQAAENKAVNGEFRNVGHWYNEEDGTSEIYYQFRSWDDEVWWALTEKDLGYIPELNTEYTLVYNENGTNVAEDDLYDDIFITAYKTVNE